MGERPFIDENPNGGGAGPTERNAGAVRYYLLLGVAGAFGIVLSLGIASTARNTDHPAFYLIVFLVGVIVAGKFLIRIDRVPVINRVMAALLFGIILAGLFLMGDNVVR